MYVEQTRVLLVREIAHATFEWPCNRHETRAQSSCHWQNAALYHTTVDVISSPRNYKRLLKPDASVAAARAPDSRWDKAPLPYGSFLEKFFFRPGYYRISNDNKREKNHLMWNKVILDCMIMIRTKQSGLKWKAIGTFTMVHLKRIRKKHIYIYIFFVYNIVFYGIYNILYIYGYSW